MNENNNMNNDNNNVSLSSLSNGAIPTASPMGMPLPKFNSNEVKDVNKRAVALPPESERPVEGLGNPMIDQAFQNLDSTIDRLQEETNQIYEEGQEQRIEKELDEDDEISVKDNNTYKVNTYDNNTSSSPSTYNDDDLFDESKEEKDVVVKKLETKTDSINTVDDDDLGLLDEEEEDQEEKENRKEKEQKEEEEKEELKNTIRNEMKKFSPLNNRLNLNNFTISKKPITASKVINQLTHKAIECADGVLWAEKRAVRMSAFSPIEIQGLDPERIRNGNYNQYMEDKLKLIYNHIIDENKPSSWKEWSKITPNVSMDDYMFVAYAATFGNANILTFNCNNSDCNNVFMKKVNIFDMIKFKNDEVKEKYFNILHSGNINSTSSKYNVNLFQVSDEYVLGLKTPSLYNSFIEPSLVDQKFMKKYENLILILTYVDSAYKIDIENNQLIPVDCKPVIGNDALTYKRRIKTFNAIIESLTSDQLQALSVETDKYDIGQTLVDGEIERDITYILPEDRCEKCGRKISESETSPDTMLFTRHQLGLMSKI